MRNCLFSFWGLPTLSQFPQIITEVLELVVIKMLILAFVLATQINLDFLVFEGDSKKSSWSLRWENTISVLNSHKRGNIWNS